VKGSGRAVLRDIRVVRVDQHIGVEENLPTGLDRFPPASTGP
jgi:hypothetical protein